LVEEANTVVEKFDPVVLPVAVVRYYCRNLRTLVIKRKGPVLVPALGEMVQILGQPRELSGVRIAVVYEEIRSPPAEEVGG
jgi:hypothetical protein